MRWLKTVFSAKNDEPLVASVRLENAPKWIQGQMRESLSIHTSRLNTAVEPVLAALHESQKLLNQLIDAECNADDYPDITIAVRKRKEEVCAQWKQHLDEFQLAIGQSHTDIKEYLDVLVFLNTQLDNIHQSFTTHSDTVRRYYPLMFNEFSHSIDQLQSTVNIMNDIADDQLIKQLNDFYSHHEHLTTKLAQKEKTDILSAKLQQKIDVQYKEFIRFQTKIDDIKNSKRYQLEQQAQGNTTSASTFSIMRQEIQELDRRKKRVEHKLHELQAQKKQFSKEVESLGIQEHIKRMEALLEQISDYHVELII